MKGKIIFISGATDGIGKQSTEFESSPATYNLEDQEKLWLLCEEYIGEKFSDIT